MTHYLPDYLDVRFIFAKPYAKRVAKNVAAEMRDDNGFSRSKETLQDKLKRMILFAALPLVPSEKAETIATVIVSISKTYSNDKVTVTSPLPSASSQPDKSSIFPSLV